MTVPIKSSVTDGLDGDGVFCEVVVFNWRQIWTSGGGVPRSGGGGGGGVQKIQFTTEDRDVEAVAPK